jgi:hypothetical protein
MKYSPPYHYQWQNPELCKTIYPFRLEKLRDFLLYFREIDLWQARRNSPVDPALAQRLTAQVAAMNLQLASRKQELAEVKSGLAALELKHRVFQQNRPARLLAIQRANLQAQLDNQQAKIRVVNSSVTWYQNYALKHPEALGTPYYQKRLAQLDKEEDVREAIQSELQKVEAAYQAEMEKAGLGTVEAERQQLQERMATAEQEIKRLSVELLKLPDLKKTAGVVTPGMAVRYELQEYARQLADLDQADLIAAILERFAKEPGRFPKWLQYMVIHFSGMRYKSAHGSWASPVDLAVTLKMEEQEAWVNTATLEQLEAAANQAGTALQAARAGANGREATRLDGQIALMKNPITRSSALKRFLTAQAGEAAHQMDEPQALDYLKSKKDELPPWAWKEIVSRTDLRLEVKDPDWEQLTPAERQERWEWENRRWRSMLDFWSGKDITGWRKQHQLTLELVVTRAVCNEIAEHIQHLRGVKPAAGLTAKPEWYLRLQRAVAQSSGKKDAAPDSPPAAEKSYLLPPGQRRPADFKPGASILWLGWVASRPNPWQITRPLSGFSLKPPQEANASLNWTYQQVGDEFQRIANPAVDAKGKKKEGKGRQGRAGWVTNWLRWTHEAIVVGVFQLADGRDYVMTFETGQIGVRLRPLAELLNSPYVYLGYTPPAPAEPPQLADMLDPATLLPSHGGLV